MVTRALNALLRVALLASLLACAALFVDYSTASSSFCDAQSGCGAVRTSAFSSILGIKLPYLGLGVFVGLFALSVWASTKSHFKVVALFTGLAGLGAVVFIGLQIFVIRAVCIWCMLVDVSAVVAALTATVLAQREPPEEGRPLRYLWSGLALVVVATPFFWPHPPPSANLPPSVVALGSPSKVNIVMFTDFECPFCRRLHPVVEEAMKQHGGRVSLVRVMKPLRGHAGAEPAALAYLCTPEAQREAMADELYAGTSAELTPKGVITIGQGLGLDGATLARCMGSPETRQKLAAEEKLFEEAALRGLPSTFVGQELVVGADVDGFHAALERSLAGHGQSKGAPITYMFVFVALLALAVVAASLKASPANPAEVN
ncbi:MAG: thioredoxin domain-containing protein [Polyangiaceae bacterium]